MRRARSRSLRALGGCVAVVCLAGTAGAAPSAVDVAVNVGASVTGTGAPALAANGSTVTVKSRNFYVFVDVALIAPVAAKATIRAELGSGLTWGADSPDPTEQCTSTPTTGECQIPDLQPITGQSSAGWFWNVVAAQNGMYTFRAGLIAISDTDSDPSNDASSITIVVDESAPPTQPPPGGGAAAAKASGVKLSPTRPKAGSTVVASVRVTRGGSAVRPSGITCSASMGGVKVRGTPRAASGVASCLFKTLKSAKGKTMSGSISFRAGGSAFTKRFATKLG
jgi:hypothetical protein